MALTGAFSLILSLVAPEKMSGGTHIAQRFALFGFVLVLAAGSSVRLPSRAQWAAAACISILVLNMWYLLARVNVTALGDTAAVLHLPPVPRGGRIASVVSDGSGYSARFNWSPTRHVGAHYARRSSGILINYEWLYVPYMHLSPRLRHRCMYDSMTTACLATNAQDASRPPIDVLVAVGPDATAVSAQYGLRRQASRGTVTVFAK